MPEVVKKRCAIYCRKSVMQEDSDVEFSNLDAQREAGEAFILSQKSNGWVCLPEHYDDGGYTGGNTNRPALQRLLSDCEAGLVDIIVVYKIDRLSRSICDFADLSKKFDEWGVQFVAVTQEINTATPSGRMMLNILITFSQFEREIIAQRVQDKMEASRKKGMFVGGTVPFGYVVVNKKLVIKEEDAKIVRSVFQRFIEVQSPKLIASELNQAGHRTKAGNPWQRDHIYRMLNNHTYIGEVKYKDAICKGEQQAIVTREVWNRVQEILKENDRNKETKDRQGIVAPLKNVLKCGHCGGAMMPTYTSRGSQRYFYYLCCKDARRGIAECPVHQIPAEDVERIVKRQLQKMLGDLSLTLQFAEKSGLSPHEVITFFKDEFWNEITPGEYNRLVTLLVETVTIWEDKMEVVLRTENIKSMMETIVNDQD